MEFLILAGLILLNGVFAMSEIAIVTARKSRLAALSAKGSASAKAALRLAEDPTQFLSTVQIGITSIGLMNGIFGEALLADPFALWLQELGMSAKSSSITATVLVIVVVTYLSIIVGELVPKRIGQISAERIACLVARPMLLLATSTKPFVVLLSLSTQWLMRVLGFKDVGDASVTEEDIHAMLKEGSVSGVIEQSEHTMVRNVFRLDERPVSSMMVPRTDIVFLDTALSLEQNMQRIMESPHSRFPVCHRHMDELIGVVNAKQLFAQAISGQEIDIKTLAQPCHFIAESFTGMALLEHFRATNTLIVFVVDEYGVLKGIVTLQDLLEALTGEFNPSHGNDLMVIQREDGSLLLDGLLSAPELKDCLGLTDLPGEKTREYETLNGLFMYLLGRVPVTTDKVVLEPWTLEIVDMDGMRIDKVLAIKNLSLPDADMESGDDTG